MCGHVKGGPAETIRIAMQHGEPYADKWIEMGTRTEVRIGLASQHSRSSQLAYERDNGSEAANNNIASDSVRTPFDEPRPQFPSPIHWQWVSTCMQI